MRAHLPLLSLTATLTAALTLTGCGTDEADPEVVKDTPTYTRAVITITNVAHQYEKTNGQPPQEIIQKGGTYIAGSSPELDGIGDRTAAVAGVHLAWYQAQGTSAIYCLETKTTHFTTHTGDAGSDGTEPVAKPGPCPSASGQ